MSVKSLKEEEFNNVINNGKVVVDCFATWCGPCRMLAPVIEELSEEISDVTFYKLDVDDAQNIARTYGIMSIPTILIFDNGELKQTSIGLKSKEELKQIING